MSDSEPPGNDSEAEGSSRLGRDDIKYDLVRLLGAHARTSGNSLSDPATLWLFLKEATQLLEEHAQNPIMTFGMRTEEMFAYVAGALGKCKLIKQEDGGNAFVKTRAKVNVPDYRIVLDDGREFLVEVKNCKSERFQLNAGYVRQLMDYAERAGKPLKIAIYWASTNIWCLTSPEKIPVSDGKHRITGLESMLLNEMGELGDVALFAPSPMKIRIHADPTKPWSFDKSTGNYEFTIGARPAYYACDTLIESERERELAEFILDFGVLELRSRSFITDVAKGEAPYDERIFEMIPPPDGVTVSTAGVLSSMLSSEYNRRTATEGLVHFFAPDLHPREIGVRIPDDYEGKYLPIKRVRMVPESFIGLVGHGKS